VLKDRITPKILGLTAVGSFVAGTVLVAVGWPTGDFLANLGVPLLAVAFVFALYDLASTAIESRRTLKAFGRKLLFLGMIVGLFGILFSAATKQTTSVPTVVFNAEGVATAQAGDVSIVLRDWTAYEGEGQVYSPEMGLLAPEQSSLKINMEMYRGDEVYLEAAWARLYTNYGAIAQPLIIHTLQGDIYTHLEVTDEMYNALVQALIGATSTLPQTASLTVSTVPLVYLLWAGVTLMCVGISLNLAGDMRKPSEKLIEDFL
jgi:cytochrome c biogenesis factor